MHPVTAPTELERLRADLEAFDESATQPMTVAQVRERYTAVTGDIQSLGYRCGQVRVWVQQNVSR